MGAVPERVPLGDSPRERPLQPRGIGLIAIATDTVALAVAAVAAAGIESVAHPHGVVDTSTFAFSPTVVRLLVTVPILTMFLATTRARWPLRSTQGQQLTTIAPAMAAGGLLSLAAWQVAGGTGIVRAPDAGALLVLFGLGFLAVPLARSAHHALRRRRGSRTRRVVIVGSGVVATRVAEQLTSMDSVEVVGFVDDDPLETTSWVGKLCDLAHVCQRDDVDHIIVGFSRSSHEELVEALRSIHGRLPITVVPRLFDVLPGSAALHDLGSGLTGISVAPAAVGHGPRVVKRTVDLLGASAALFVLSPVLAAVAIAIKLTSSGPVLFHQERIGRNGDRFLMTKFRSMRVEAVLQHPSMLKGQAVIGPFPKLKDDPRVTRIGRLIRRTSIDELPQLLNVLKGEMSLVGPRPFVPEDSAWIDGWAEWRYSVRPGITGLWQVSGRNDLTFDEMCRLDNLYVSCWSIMLDMGILLRTMRAVVARNGAY